jgi:PKD repeat protein
MIQNNNYKGGTTMYKKLTLYFTLFLVCLTSVFASNTLELHYYDEDGNDVDNVEVSLFECTNSSCSAIDSSRVDYDDTGSSNDATLTIPSQSSETYFVAYAFAEESDSYLPHSTTFSLDGNGHSADWDVTLSKKDICRSTIQSFSVTNSVAPNEPIYVDVEAALEADTYSAFQYSDTDVYAYGDGSSTYGDWFTAETLVELTIVKEITFPGLFGGDGVTVIIPVYSDSETVYIQAEDSENVAFSYTPTTQGTYLATVTTTVPDAQCASTEEQSSSEEFDVVSEEDVEYCYTLIDNLAVQEIEDGSVSELQVGETYTVTFDKLSNEVDSDGNLIPTDTALDVTVYDDTGAVTYTFSAVSGNADTDYAEYSFSWTPIMEGDNTIEVYGIADNCPYSENNAETETLTIYVAGEDGTLYPPVADADGSLLLGFIFSDTATYDVDFDGSNSYDTNPDGSGYIVSYDWDFGDGTTDTGVAPTHTFTGTGPFTVTLTVTDNDGLTDTDTLTVRRFDIGLPDFDFDPRADCGGPYSATLGDSITFDGTGYEFGGGAVTFAWDFGDGSTSTEEDPTYTYSAEGVYTVTLTVTDDEGDTDSCTTTATITAVTVNEAPEVDCSVLPTTGTVDEIVTFDVDATDSDGTIVQYDWDFGDGSTDSTTTDSTTYTYTSADTYTVTVQVTDDAGETAQCTQDITISEEAENQAPTADCSALPTSAEVLENVYFDGTASTDSDGTIDYYAWDFGYLDPSGNSMGVGGPTLSETVFGYGEAGTYTVTLTVTDNDGATDSCTQDIVISEAEEPAVMTVEIIADPTSGIAPLPVSFSADVENGVEPFTYAWDFGDGSTSTDAAPVYTYTVDGTYTVTLVVTDADGQTATDTEVITVDADLPAIAVASANPTSGEPTLWVQFSSAGSSGNEPLSYSWSFSDGGSSTSANPSHYYHSEGTYTATLTVTDADGDTDSDTVTITVSDELENIASRHYYVDGIALSNDGRVRAGDDLELWVGAENIADIDKSAVTFNAIIQELGIYETSGEFDLDAGESEMKVLSISIPEDTEPGTYYVRVTISDDDVRRVIYRDIIVTE